VATGRYQAQYLGQTHSRLFPRFFSPLEGWAIASTHALSRNRPQIRQKGTYLNTLLYEALICPISKCRNPTFALFRVQTKPTCHVKSSITSESASCMSTDSSQVLSLLDHLHKLQGGADARNRQVRLISPQLCKGRWTPDCDTLCDLTAISASLLLSVFSSTALH
jgi:hypothetical protein